ncbi:MAG: DUF2237 domain-containing protein [Bacteroidales bacterium]|nr:DUF2237 domain-containing protein [Bacteroidales bacterium]
MAKNILGTELIACSSNPVTGFYRDGKCRTGATDFGTHTVFAIMTEAFLRFSFDQGNDLISPAPKYMFPGLGPGDRWCLCALRWKEAYEAGVAPPVIPEATHENTLEFLALSELLNAG